MLFNVYRTRSKHNAFCKEANYQAKTIKETKTINEACTKMKLIRPSRTTFGELYCRIRELQEGTVDFNQLADNYFKETGKRLLNDGVSLTMETSHMDDSDNYLKSTIYENGKIIGSAFDFKFHRVLSCETDRTSLIILLLYYIGFTPEQIEYSEKSWWFPSFAFLKPSSLD